MANKGKRFPPEILNQEEIQRFISSFPKTKTGKRNLALITVYLRSQLRCNEALNLRPCDIDWKQCAITVLRGKGGKRRVVGIDKGALEVVKKWDNVRPESEYFFCTHGGGQMDTSYVRRLVKRHARTSGIEKRVHPHGFRHTGACELADEGIDIRIISKQLGHTTLAVTDRYLDHLSPGAVISAIRDRQPITH